MSAITWSEAELHRLPGATARGARNILMDDEWATSWAKLARKLSAIGSLKDDWDGLGASAPSPEVKQAADRLFANRRQYDPYTPPNRIIAGPDGSIVFEWRLGLSGLQMQIDEPGQVTFVLESPGEEPHIWSDRFDRTNLESTWEDDRQYPSATG
jgi:hypothetical protein